MKKDEKPRWGVFVGRHAVHFSIGVQTFQINNAADGDPEEREHLEFVRDMLEHALRALSGTEPAPLQQLANNYLARKDT